MTVRRLFVEKRQGYFDIPAQQLCSDLKETFGDDCTCCTWCATCKRKKDVTGRRGFGWQGLEKEYNELYNSITTTY